eukprot:TRINITY_DN648_c0_g1_i2.p1 TRINITY_DN648_c0_g1~~TRINITY_DN648_c0_g1_i2.p1  ORF type:complete len:226 (+),score=33.03 TRINITY_DN648_c0_g1_i2:82-759(+)
MAFEVRLGGRDLVIIGLFICGTAAIVAGYGGRKPDDELAQVESAARSMIRSDQVVRMRSQQQQNAPPPQPPAAVPAVRAPAPTPQPPAPSQPAAPPSTPPPPPATPAGGFSCPDGVFTMYERCWVLGPYGGDCETGCAAKGLKFSLKFPDEPILPRMLPGKTLTDKFPWGPLECLVEKHHTYHKVEPSDEFRDQGVMHCGEGCHSSTAGTWKYWNCNHACPCVPK